MQNWARTSPLQTIVRTEASWTTNLKASCPAPGDPDGQNRDPPWLGHCAGGGPGRSVIRTISGRGKLIPTATWSAVCGYSVFFPFSAEVLRPRNRIFRVSGRHLSFCSFREVNTLPQHRLRPAVHSRVDLVAHCAVACNGNLRDPTK